jgi:gamma-glutamylcyclotransferase (GGCT)/AIG2-like uncharacterized protein YtfP
MSKAIKLAAEGEQLMFVYGTLRIGESNYSWCREAVKWGIDGATAGGRMYLPKHRGFPYVDFRAPGTVIGSLLCFDVFDDYKGSLYNDVCRMEAGAGYQLAEISVKLPWSNQTVRAEAWHYDRVNGLEQIKSGNWFDKPALKSKWDYGTATYESSSQIARKGKKKVKQR